MKEIYKNYLFEKHILVSEHQEDAQKDPFAAAFAMASLLGIKITRGEKLLRKYMIKYAASRLGINVPEPFYKGFPGSVRQLCPDQLLFDQLVHYTVTYGFGDFSHAGHSLFEDQFERAAFKEDTDLKLFSVITKDEAVSMLGEITADLLAGPDP